MSRSKSKVRSFLNKNWEKVQTLNLAKISDPYLKFKLLKHGNII